MAHPPARGGAGVIRAALLVLVLLAGPAAAMDVAVAPYREASLAGATGTVSGRIYAQSRTPTGPDQPLTGTTVTLVPRSPAVLLELERLREQSRQSSRAFAGAAPAMRQVQERYERELLEAGVPDLAPRISVNPDGSFRLTEIPVGEWLLVAWLSSQVDVSPPKPPGREGRLYQLERRVTGYQAVTIWLRELTLGRGETVSLALNDRNEWFRGVIEETEPGAGR